MHYIIYKINCLFIKIHFISLKDVKWWIKEVWGDLFFFKKKTIILTIVIRDKCLELLFHLETWITNSSTNY